MSTTSSILSREAAAQREIVAIAKLKEAVAVASAEVAVLDAALETLAGEETGLTARIAATQSALLLTAMSTETLRSEAGTSQGLAEEMRKESHSLAGRIAFAVRAWRTPAAAPAGADPYGTNVDLAVIADLLGGLDAMLGDQSLVDTVPVAIDRAAKDRRGREMRRDRSVQLVHFDPLGFGKEGSSLKAFERGQAGRRQQAQSSVMLNVSGKTWGDLLVDACGYFHRVPHRYTLVDPAGIPLPNWIAIDHGQDLDADDAAPMFCTLVEKRVMLHTGEMARTRMIERNAALREAAAEDAALFGAAGAEEEETESSEEYAPPGEGVQLIATRGRTPQHRAKQGGTEVVAMDTGLQDANFKKPYVKPPRGKHPVRLIRHCELLFSTLLLVSFAMVAVLRHSGAPGYYTSSAVRSAFADTPIHVFRDDADVTFRGIGSVEEWWQWLDRVARPTLTTGNVAARCPTALPHRFGNVATGFYCASDASLTNATCTTNAVPGRRHGFAMPPASQPTYPTPMPTFIEPTPLPTRMPTRPTVAPTASPTATGGSQSPTLGPSSAPTAAPSGVPTTWPTLSGATFAPSAAPTVLGAPPLSRGPTAAPTAPTAMPTTNAETCQLVPGTDAHPACEEVTMCTTAHARFFVGRMNTVIGAPVLRQWRVLPGVRGTYQSFASEYSPSPLEYAPPFYFASNDGKTMATDSFSPAAVADVGTYSGFGGFGTCGDVASVELIGLTDFTEVFYGSSCAYSVSLPPEGANWDAAASKLSWYQWIDRNTRYVMLDVPLFNVNDDIFISARFGCEFSAKGAVNCNTNVEAFRLTPTGVSDTDHAVFRQSIEWAAIVLVALTLLGRLSDLLRTIHRATTHIHWKAEVAWALPTHCGCRSMRRDHTSKKSAEILVQAAQKDSAAAELQDAYDETTDTLYNAVDWIAFLVFGTGWGFRIAFDSLSTDVEAQVVATISGSSAKYWSHVDFVGNAILVRHMRRVDALLIVLLSVKIFKFMTDNEDMMRTGEYFKTSIALVSNSLFLFFIVSVAYLFFGYVQFAYGSVRFRDVESTYRAMSILQRPYWDKGYRMYFFPTYDLFFVIYMFGNIFVAQAMISAMLNYAVQRVEGPARMIEAARSR